MTRINRKLAILRPVKREYDISLYLTLLVKIDPELDTIEDLCGDYAKFEI